MALVLRKRISMADLVARWQGIAAGALVLTTVVLCLVIWWFGRRRRRAGRGQSHDRERAA